MTVGTKFNLEQIEADAENAAEALEGLERVRVPVALVPALVAEIRRLLKIAYCQDCGEERIGCHICDDDK